MKTDHDDTVFVVGPRPVKNRALLTLAGAVDHLTDVAVAGAIFGGLMATADYVTLSSVDMSSVVQATAGFMVGTGIYKIGKAAWDRRQGNEASAEKPGTGPAP